MKNSGVIFAISVVAVAFLAVSLPTEAKKQSVKIVKLGSAKAKKGGTFYTAITEPKTLHPLNSSDYYASQVQSYVMDSLMKLNLETYEYEPGVATHFEIGKGEKSYTFYIRKDAQFHDGKPLTAKDVKFSFDSIVNGKFKTAHTKPYFESIKEALLIDDYTIRFTVKKKYFNNFRILAALDIIPMHFYKDPKAKLNKTLLGSGPYKFSKYIKGKSLFLKRNPDWWGFKVAHLKNSSNFGAIFFRFLKEEATRLEYLKKGRLSFIGLSPDQYVKKTTGKIWGKKVFKQKVTNKTPQSYGYVGWNFLDKKFKDRNVRKALAHLMNRKLMNEKFRFGMSLLATGPWYRQSPYAAKVAPIRFNPQKASKMLKKAGWKDTNKDGVLDKKIGKKRVSFKFTILFSNPDGEKYLTVYKEDLKKAGVVANLKRVEWNSLLAAVDEKKFEAVNLGWGGGSVHNDPKQIWHSSSARKGGSNFISYKNPVVDKLIEKGRKETNVKKRFKIYKKVYKLIAEDAPYAFLFNNKYSLFAHSKSLKFEKPTYTYGLGQDYWWLTQ